MAIIFEYRTQFLIAFLLLLLLLLMIPVRAETAEAGSEKQITESTVSYNHSGFPQRCSNFISQRMHIPSLMRKNKTSLALESMLKAGGVHIRSYTSQAPFQQATDQDDSGVLSIRNIQATILPLVEISYSLSNKVALEIRGHLNQSCNKDQPSPGSPDDLYGYTLFFGPSFYAGTPGDTSRMYTQFGLAYNVIDSTRNVFSGDCPTSLGTGFSLGLKRLKADIRIGYNYFNALSGTSSHLGLHENLDVSSLFLFVTYNFDS